MDANPIGEPETCHAYSNPGFEAIYPKALLHGLENPCYVSKQDVIDERLDYGWPVVLCSRE